MSHRLKGVGSFLIVIVLAYLAIRYWANIKAAGTAVASGKGSRTSANTSSGAPGDPAFSSAFGGSGGRFSSSGNAVVGPTSAEALNGGPAGFNGGFTGFGGSGGGAIDYSYLAAGSNTGPVPNSFGPNCSTHLTDGKPLCE